MTDYASRISRSNSISSGNHKESHIIDMSFSKPSSKLAQCQLSLEERVLSLEESKCKCIAISKEIKLVQAELNIIADWIQSKFDTLLIDRSSYLYRLLHQDIEEVDRISKSLTITSNSKLTKKNYESSSSILGTPKSGSYDRKRTEGSRATDKSNKTSRKKQKPNLRGVLGTWINIDDCTVPNETSSICTSRQETLRQEDSYEDNLHALEIKQEVDESLAHDPFEDGYIPEVDEEGNVNVDFMETPIDVRKDIKESTEQGLTRPKRSSTKNVSYNGYLDSEEEEPIQTEKLTSKKKRGYNISEDKLDKMEKTEDTNAKKKYNPSKASTARAKILANTPMMCDECGKVVKGPWTLKAHKEMHANIRRYTCHVCGYAFRRKPHLNAHLLLHEGVKHLKCQYCGRGFYLRRDLARHERTHTGEKPYNCTFPNCSKSFNVKQHLTMHYRTHTGERPYKCTICEKSFSQANTLRIHKKLHEERNSSTNLSGRRKPKTNIKINRGNNESSISSNAATSEVPISRNVQIPPTTTCHNQTLSSHESSSADHEQNHLQTSSLSSSPSTSSNSATVSESPNNAGRGIPNPNPQTFRSPSPSPKTLNQVETSSDEPFSIIESRQGVLNNILLPSTSSSSPHNNNPFDILQQSWRQGGIITNQPISSSLSSASSTLVLGSHQTPTNPGPTAATTGLFLPQIYEPLNIHFTTSYHHPNSSS